MQNDEHDEQRMITDHNQTIAAHNQHRAGPTRAPLWYEDDFVSRHVQTAIQYWKETVSTGIFEGSQFKGADVTPIELPNHAPTSHDGWVNTEIEPLVQESSLATWSTVTDMKAQPRPRICLPLEVESNKPRLIWDARYLNSICKQPPFSVERSRESRTMILERGTTSHTGP